MRTQTPCRLGRWDPYLHPRPIKQSHIFHHSFVKPNPLEMLMKINITHILRLLPDYYQNTLSLSNEPHPPPHPLLPFSHRYTDYSHPHSDLQTTPIFTQDTQSTPTPILTQASSIPTKTTPILTQTTPMLTQTFPILTQDIHSRPLRHTYYNHFHLDIQTTPMLTQKYRLHLLPMLTQDIQTTPIITQTNEPLPFSH